MKPTLYTNNNINDNHNQNRALYYVFFTVFIVFFTGLGAKKFYFNKKRRQKVTMTKLASEPKNVLKTNPYNNLIDLAIKNDSSFYLTFLEVYPDFAKKLLDINPTIKASDIEYCAYIKLNLDTKQIAVLKNISVRAVEGKKYRIRKKLDISIDENMYIWLSKL